MSIVINLPKAKEIGHAMRRAKRAEEFAPHDEVIMKQIPGVDAAAAEEARQEIRDKYAVMQDAIEAATSPDDIKVALELVAAPAIEEPVNEIDPPVLEEGNEPLPADEPQVSDGGQE